MKFILLSAFILTLSSGAWAKPKKSSRHPNQVGGDIGKTLSEDNAEVSTTILMDDIACSDEYRSYTLNFYYSAAPGGRIVANLDATQFSINPDKTARVVAEHVALRGDEIFDGSKQAKKNYMSTAMFLKVGSDLLLMDLAHKNLKIIVLGADPVSDAKITELKCDN